MRKLLGVLGGVALIGASLSGCVPSAGSAAGGTANAGAPTTAPAPPTAPPVTSPHAPIISAFSASTTNAPSPLTAALRWTISDPGNDVLTCYLDIDGNGTWDVTVNNCTSDSSRTRTFATPGSTGVVLAVTDGTWTTTAVTAVNVAAPAADQYSVTLRLGGSMTSGQMAAFTSAAAKWAGIVKTGQPDRTVNLAANYCTSGTSAYAGVIDDLLIDAQIIPIDGPGNVLGQAGPCLVRSSNGIPLYGIMQFDSADVGGLETQGQLSNTIVHEMGHILGIGTIWNTSLLVGKGTSNPTFTGVNTVAAWRELGGAGNVPVENSGGSGTADAHWRETTFKTELMTGYLNGTNQLSFLTAASLADLGYGVDLNGADPYGLPAVRAASVQANDLHADHEHGDDHGFVTVLPKGEA